MRSMDDAERLGREHEAFHLIAEASNDGIWLTDGAALITFVNERLARMLGVTPADLIGSSPDAFIADQTGALERDRLTRPPTHGPSGAPEAGDRVDSFAVCFNGKDGSTLWTEVRVTPIHAADGRSLGTVATMTDVSIRRERLALSASELHYRTLAEAMPHVVFTTDAIGVTDYCNRAWCEYTGLTLEATSDNGWAAVIHPDDLPRSVEAWRTAIERGEPFETQQRVRRASDGAYRWFVDRMIPIRDATGAIVKWIGSSADIHDFKLATQTRSVLDSMGHIISIVSDTGFEYLSSSWGHFTGMGDDVAPDRSWREYIHPDDVERIEHQIRVIRESDRGAGQCEIRVRSRDGLYRWFLARTAALPASEGTAQRRVNIWTDIDDFKRTQAAYGESEARYRALTESMPQMVWIGDERIMVQYVNERWLSYTGLTFEPGMPSKTMSIVHPDDVATLLDAHAQLRVRRNVDCELRFRRHDGVYRWHLLRTVLFGESDGVMQSIVTATDIEARKSAEAALAQSVAELTHRALHDPLTRLPNRTKLVDRLEAMIAQAERERMNVAVLYLDVDHFKMVNDTLGHDAGDQLLVEVATRINGSLRAEDTASRLGGDEFVLVCAVDGVVEAAAVAERLAAAVRAPIEIGGKRVVVASSIGLSLYPQDGGTPAELMQKADAAMYAAKQSGRDSWCFYNAQTALPAVAALELELELRDAITREEFVVYYQPIIDLESGRAIGAEALVRWAHPMRGLLSPDEFIAFAEEHGMIAQIGDAVLNAACAQLGRLKLRSNDSFSIAVNVSARQFSKPSFVGTIATALAVHGISARHLEIEITESVVMAETQAVIATLERLKALGVRLSIDDFGTGYSSLAYLKNFPIHTLKIDRSFVCDIATSFADQAIAKTIVTLAHSLGMRTIAEGVENTDQLERLRSFGADCFQGYLVSRPLPAAEFEAFLLRPRSLIGRTQ